MTQLCSLWLIHLIPFSITREFLLANEQAQQSSTTVTSERRFIKHVLRFCHLNSQQHNSMCASVRPAPGSSTSQAFSQSLAALSYGESSAHTPPHPAPPSLSLPGAVCHAHSKQSQPRPSDKTQSKHKCTRSFPTRTADSCRPPTEPFLLRLVLRGTGSRGVWLPRSLVSRAPGAPRQKGASRRIPKIEFGACTLRVWKHNSETGRWNVCGQKRCVGSGRGLSSRQRLPHQKNLKTHF